MTIDKSWTKLRNCGCRKYWDGLQALLRMTSNHADLSGRIRCPCIRYNNFQFDPLKVVQAHVFDKGFQQAYDKWIFHWEVEETILEEVVDNN